MKKIRKLIYNYVFKRVVAWQEGRIEDQELTDALYTYCDTNLKEAKILKQAIQKMKEENR